MTRYARAKGSKASNEKLPEEATSWGEMRKGMVGKHSHIKKVKEQNTSSDEVVTHKKTKNKTMNRKCFNEVSEDSTLASAKRKNKHNQETALGKSKPKKAKVLSRPNDQSNEKKKHKLQKSNQSGKSESSVTNDSKKKQFPPTKKQQFNVQKKWEQKGKFKNPDSQRNQNTQNTDTHVKTKKGIRRKGDQQPMEVNINGKMFMIVPFDGFYIMEDDAKRLTQLRRDLKEKGIPSTQIISTIKLERRRAEKALARAKKKVCFNCRMFGHNLSECPTLDEKTDTTTGVCYKCGSTEHTYFQCKVTHGQDFRFASCFICKEQGHIARQCPDNPRGLYPNGGACKLCGDVTHLKKDCPKLAAENEEKTVTLNTHQDKLEGIEEDFIKTDVKKVKKNKIIHF